jgi:sec-independent protein translocase protein TatA
MESEPRPRGRGQSGFFRSIPPFGLFPLPGFKTRYPERMPNVGPWEIILLLLLALLLFGAKRLPEIGRSMGRGLREFKDSVGGKDDPDAPAELPLTTTPAETPARERDTVS